MSVEDQVRAYYERQALGDAEVNKIIRAAQRRPRGRRARLAAAAVAVAGGAAIATWFLWPASPAQIPEADTTILADPAGRGTEPLLEEILVASQPAIKPMTGSLVITSEPAGAVVYVDGEKQGITPLSVDGLAVGRGYDVKLEMAGYATTRQTTTLDAGEPNFAHVVLARPKPGQEPKWEVGSTATLVVTSSPTDLVSVYLDGELIGERTPITRSDIPIGQHTMRALADGYKEKRYRFELAAGHPAVVNIELEPLVKSLDEEKDDERKAREGGFDSGGEHHLTKTHYAAGITALKRSEFSKAIAQFKACIQAVPKHCMCHRALGITYARAGNGPEAHRYYKLYLEHCPQATDAPQVHKLIEAYELREGAK